MGPMERGPSPSGTAHPGLFSPRLLAASQFPVHLADTSPASLLSPTLCTSDIIPSFFPLGSEAQRGASLARAHSESIALTCLWT